MKLQELNSGIVFTNDSCIGCNKCISGCIAVGASVVVRDETSGRYSVLVDPNKCIFCGTCIEMCVHQARTYRDDTDEFFAALERGERISILVSPTLLTDYEKQYHNILGYLKHTGVNHIYNTGFGGDLMVWVYMNFIRDYGLSGIVSQVCPVITNYLEKYRPELLPYLMPVQSPVMCTAIYVKEYLNIDDKLAFISPCIASKQEIDDVNNYGLVSYNVTFERLMQRLEGIDLSVFRADDEVDYGLGALVPMAGGLSDNIERYIGFNEVLIQTAGPDNIFPYFEHYYKEVSGDGQLPFLIDALSCTNGCNFGTGTRCGVELRNEMTFSAHHLKEHAYRSGMESRASNPTERFEILNQKFAEFDLCSFVRQYDLTRAIPETVISEAQIEEIFDSMYKYEDVDRHADCGSCGYMTCRAMAQAIATNVNHKENCINYSKGRIRRETEKTNQLLEEISLMNEELMVSTQLKSNFLANMSHEIRTPMNAIIGMAEMALRCHLGEEERGYLHQIKASGRSLLAIINDILDFSKIESGKMELNETEYEVMSIINDTVNIVMTRIGEKDIHLIVDADPEVPYSLYGDDIRIKQVLVNLANNAVKFTRKGCVELQLHYEKPKDCDDEIDLILSVSDTGIGIKPEDVEKLFTSFQQLDSKRNRNEEGTGLGLVISREFVRLMHGEISVESTYGVGSTFSFRIPQKVVDVRPSVAVKDESAIKTCSLIKNAYVREGLLKAVRELKLDHRDCRSLQELEQAVEQGAQFAFISYLCWDEATDRFARENADKVQTIVIVDPRKDVVDKPYIRKLNQPVYSLNIASVINHESLDIFTHANHEEEFRFEAPEAKILIVDDNTINLTVAKGLLSPLHMDIQTAISAQEALAMLVKQEFDIVFMDHMMPDIDGVEATHMIRELGGAYKDLTIIALTANAVNDAKEMFLREGMNDFVAKPIEMLDITAKLRKWLPPEKIKQLTVPEPSAAPKAVQLEIEGLDVAAGINLSGTLDLYLSVLADYVDVIEKKADLIEQYEKESNLASYTIEVHALKSASKLIGATDLSNMAARLEHCGHLGEWDEIHADTDELLRRYRSYLPILAPYARAAVEANVEMDAQEITGHLSALLPALDDFDIDAAKAVTDTLRTCRLSEADSQLCLALCEAVDEMEYDDAAEKAKAWMEHLAQ